MREGQEKRRGPVDEAEAKRLGRSAPEAVDPQSNRAGETLGRLEEEFTAVFRGSPDGVLITRLDDETVLDVNDSFLRTMGYTRSEVVGKPSAGIPAWANPEDRDLFVRALKERKECSRLQTAFYARDGSLVPAVVSARRVEVEGAPCVISIIQDISKLVKAEEALRQSEKRYRQLVERATDIIYTTDAQGFFTFVNPVAVRITGYAGEEIIGKQYLDFIRPDYRERVEKFYGSQFADRIADTYYEFPILSKTGETVWLGQNVQLVWEANEIVGFRSICRDITARKRTEESLHQSESRFRLLAEAAPFGLSLMLADGTVGYVNPKFTELFGYTREDVADKRAWFKKAYPDEHYRDMVIAVWNEDTQEKVARGEVCPRVFTVRCKDGSDKVIQFRAVIMEGGGQILTFEDITLQARSAQALHESETKYRGLFESANDAIFMLRDDRFIECNARALEMLGCGKDEIIAQPLLRFCRERQPDGSVSRAEAAGFIRAALDGKKQIFPWQFKRLDGSVLDTEVSLGLMEGSDEAVLLLIVRDITTRLQAEEALREHEQMLTNILAASPVGICRVEERKISWVNEAMIQMFGYGSEQEFIGMTTRDLYASQEEYERVGSTLYANYGTGTESETYGKLIRKDGTVFDGHVRISAPDPAHRMRGTIAVFSDISRLREAERAREESELRYRRLVEQVPDVIFALDSFGRFTFVNVQAEKFLGYPISRMLGTPLWDYSTPKYTSLAQSILNVQPETIWDEELGVLDSKGGQKWVRIRCQSSYDEEGRLIGFDGVMVDRTVRKRLEEELRASREQLLAKIKIIDDLYAHMVQSEKTKAIAEHTAEVAHELRQPLAIIGGFARRIAHQLDETGGKVDLTRQKEILEIIIKEVKRLESILGGLIDFSRREAIRLVSTDPNALIRDLLRVHEERFSAKKLKVKAYFGEGIGEVFLDQNRFGQVIRNLVSNAVEASLPNGVIEVRTRLFRPSSKAQKTGELTADKYFEMKIKNGGRIIPPDELQRLFDPFYTTKGFGIGIGLTVSKKIIDEHKGSISVKSDSDGTVFTVWIPLKPSQSMVPAGLASEDKASSGCGEASSIDQEEEQHK